MFESLKGAVVIITGSGAGIGQAAAEQFAQLGAHVVVNSRSDTGQRVCAQLQQKGHSCIFVRADVSTGDGVAAVLRAAIDQFGRIDVLINNAGIVPGGSIESTTEEHWDYAMAVNVKSVFLMSKACLPYLRKAKGTIINTTSTVAIKGVRDRALYSATKGAVLSLSRSMAAEYIAEGIRVNCICPGTVYTPSFQARVNQSAVPEQALRELTARQPMGRLGKPEEIATAMVAMASQDLGFMSGANVVMDGGMTI